MLQEQIYKPSNQGTLKQVKKAFKRTGLVKKYVTLSQTQFKWYDTLEELRTDNYHGCVKLPFIYEADKMSAIETDASFRLGVTLYDN